MRTTALFAALLGVVSAYSAQYLANQDVVANAGFRIPSVRESTAMARKIMHLSSIGNLVTVFPSASSHDSVAVKENRPASVEGNPIGLMEYYADCEPSSGNPILLGINIATPFRNYAAGSNISLSIRWWPIEEHTYSLVTTAHDGDDDEIPTPHTPAALPRFSLHGYLETVSKEKLESQGIAACFLKAHPDSIYWQPGNDIHTSQYMQLVVEHIYWFGGFGDRSRIGWLPISDWKNLTMEEIMGAKLPGEKKAKQVSRWSKNWL